MKFEQISLVYICAGRPAARWVWRLRWI